MPYLSIRGGRRVQYQNRQTTDAQLTSRRRSQRPRGNPCTCFSPNLTLCRDQIHARHKKCFMTSLMGAVSRSSSGGERACEPLAAAAAADSALSACLPHLAHFHRSNPIPVTSAYAQTQAPAASAAARGLALDHLPPFNAASSLVRLSGSRCAAAYNSVKLAAHARADHQFLLCKVCGRAASCLNLTGMLLVEVTERRCLAD